MKQTAIRTLLIVLFFLIYSLALKYDKATAVLFAFVTTYILEGLVTHIFTKPNA